MADNYLIGLVKEKLTIILPKVPLDIMDKVDLAIRNHITAEEDGRLLLGCVLFSIV